MDANTNPAPTALQFNCLPTELRDIIWMWAAEERVATFKQLIPGYLRYWHLKHRPPYVKCLMHSLSPSVVRTVRDLFWPLFQVNRESYDIVKNYVITIRQRGTVGPKLVLNFFDKFILSRYTLTQMAVLSNKSDDELRALAGITTVAFPPTLETCHRQQLDDLTRAMNLSVPAPLFDNTSSNIACQKLLLRCRSLRTMYLDITGITMNPPRAALQWTEADTLKSKNYLELGDFQNGQFRLKCEDRKSFDEAYAKRFDELILEVYADRLHNLCATERRRILVQGSRTVWEEQELWKQDFKTEFLDAIEPFLKKGIECVLVCDCRVPESIGFLPNTIQLPRST
ncbi:hypothetical protein F5Y13DRAFT_5843 [Hypoxylon sp. FL1857]|nr:hypothetical protein F5Y13DRAFT_5843 [Hypoxylon sp. FL1857]